MDQHNPTMRERGLKALDLCLSPLPCNDATSFVSYGRRRTEFVQEHSAEAEPKNLSFYTPRIRDLGLSACGIISIENGTFSQMPLLMRFNLARNGLEDIPPAVMVLPQLQWFSLRGNERNRMKLNEKLMKSILAFPS